MAAVGAAASLTSDEPLTFTPEIVAKIVAAAAHREPSSKLYQIMEDRLDMDHDAVILQRDLQHVLNVIEACMSLDFPEMNESDVE